jgi:HlyD family secretion protein
MSFKKWLLLFLLVVAVLSALGWSQSQHPQQSSAPNADRPIKAVAAIGRIEPASRVVRIAAMDGDARRIRELKVTEGQQLSAQAIIAVLDTHAPRQAALHEAEAKVDAARAQLAKVKAGAKPGDIAAKEASLRRLKTMTENADADFRRMQRLLAQKAANPSEFDDRRSKAESLRQELQQVEAELAGVREVRSVDVALAEAELREKQAAVETSKAQLELALVRAPFAGQVLKICTWPGEKVSDKGILEFADTTTMDAVAEVYESDVGRVRLGANAQVKVSALGKTLTGKVTQIGLMIGKKDVLNNDPVADTDARVVEVRVRLDSECCSYVRGLTNLRVEVLIEPE